MGETCQNDPILDFIAFRKERGEKKEEDIWHGSANGRASAPALRRLREPEKILIGRERK